MTKRSPVQTQDAPALASAVLITPATPFRFVSPEKSSPVISLLVPPMETAKVPPVIPVHSEGSASSSGRTAPLSTAGVAVFAHLPILSCEGRGDWEKNSSAALYSGVDTPKSAATPSIPV